MINTKECPLCKKENFCEAHIPNNNCWCNETKVPVELIALVPNELKRKACICKNCVLLYQSNKDRFIKEITSGL